MKNHNATSTPAPAVCQPDVVRSDIWPDCYSKWMHLHAVCASAAHWEKLHEAIWVGQ